MDVGRSVLIALVAALVVVALLRVAKREAPTQDGVTMLKYSLPLKVVGVGAGVLLVALCGAGLFNVIAVNEPRAFVVGASLALGAAGTFTIAEATLVSVLVDESGFLHQSPWRGKRRVEWDDVIDYSHSSVNAWTVLRTEKDKFRISDFMVGADVVTEIVRKRGIPKAS